MKDLKTYLIEGFRLGKNKVDRDDDDFVDLNLPSKILWCKYNVGAKPGSTAESWYGDYFMWGDTESVGSKTCDWTNYKYCNGNNKTFTKYCNIDKISCWAGKGKPDNKLTLDEEDDMANANMGGDWKMPTEDDIQELIDNTTHEWVKRYNNIQGLNGILFKSKMNNNTLFIPAAGYHDFNSKNSVNETRNNACIWSSTLNYKYSYDAYYLNSYSHNTYLTNKYRCCACPVRAVMN